MHLTSSISDSTSHGSSPRQWTKLESPNATHFTPDEQIEHYKQWKDAAMSEYRIMRERNLKLAAQTIENLINGLSSKNIEVLNAYIKHQDTFKLGALILVKKEDYLSDEFRYAFELSRNLTQEVNDKIFHLEITFASETEDTDESMIYCDGYTLKRAEANE